jgi:hypothetical protein
MASRLRVYDDEGEEIALPLKWEICGTCEGKGTSCAYLGAFTSDDFANDPDFAEDYMAGGYDRQCDECGGSGKVQHINYDALSSELRKRVDDAADDERAYRAEVEMERRMGA